MNSQAHFSAAKINPHQMSSTILPSLPRVVPACRQAESKSTLALSAFMKLLKTFLIALLGTAFTASASFAESTRPNCFLIQSIQAGSTTEIDDLKITNLDNGIVVYENNFESVSDATRGLNSYYWPQGGKDSDNYVLNGSKTRVENGKLILETTGFNQNGYGGYESHSEMESAANLPTNFRVEFTARRLQWAGHTHFMLFRRNASDAAGTHTLGGSFSSNRSSGSPLDIIYMASSGSVFQDYGIRTNLGTPNESWAQQFTGPAGSLQQTHKMALELQGDTVSFYLDGALLKSTSVAGWSAVPEPVTKEFSYDLLHINQADAEKYLASSNNLRKYSEWQSPAVTYWGPTANGVEGQLVYKFPLGGNSTQIRLKASDSSWNGSDSFGRGCSMLEASRDGVTWFTLKNSLNPRQWGVGWSYENNLPQELLGSAELWVRVKMYVENSPNSSYTVAQFGRSSSAATAPVFSIRAQIHTGDTDGDGVNDYREQKDGTDPNNASSFDTLSKGLVAYYPFNGNANDESGFGFSGSVVGVSPISDRIGINGNAYNFSGNGQYIQIPKITPLQNVNELTISAWYKFDGSQSGQLFAAGDHRGGYDPFSMRIGLNGFEDFGVGSAQRLRIEGSLNYKDKVWRHIVMVLKKTSETSSQLKVYQDSFLVNTQTSNNLVFVNYEEGMVSQIGAIHSEQFWKGDLDEFRFYNRALSETEVSQLYAKESENPNMVTVQGGTLPQSSAFAGQSVNAFQIGKYEVTSAEWKTIRAWAVANGYDLGADAFGGADNHPIVLVNWYDVVKWCNAKSQMEGLIPVYQLNGSIYKNGELGRNGSDAVKANLVANGYRLPTEVEWEWSARGAEKSKNYTYSGSNNLDAVGWYNNNSLGSPINFYQGRSTWPVGLKAPNELGIYDMSGNVMELCEDLYGTLRVRRGGSWVAGAYNCRVTYPDYHDPDQISNLVGFRLARNSGTPDTTAPVIAITSISANARLTSANATFGGTITETGSKPTLQYRLGTAGNWTSSTVGGSASPYSFSQLVALKPGPNTVQLQAKDDAGNTSALASVNVSYVVASTLTITAPNAADGSVTSGFGGSTSREVGVSYTVTATPASGMLFKEWLKNGVSAGTNATLSFTMQPGLTLTPVFVPDFAKLGGFYNGLVGVGAIGNGSAADMQAFAVNNGFIQITSGTNGALSGVLKIEGKSHSFNGTMGANKKASITVARPGKGNATLSLSLISALPGEISGNVTTSGEPLAFRALRAAYTAGAAKHALAGKRYAIVLPPPSGLAMGYGHATLTVEDNGAAVLSGVLASGQAVNAGARIVDDGAGNWVFPVYVGASGIFTGEIVIPKTTPASGSELGGSLEWFKPASNTGLFKSGFLKSLQPLGATHSAASAGLGGAAFSLTLDPAKRVLPAAVTQNGTWANSGSPSLNTPVKSGLTVSFNPLSGKFEGSFTRTVNGAPLPTPIQGTLFSRPITIPGGATLRGAGFFTSGNASTAVEVTTP